MKYTETSCENEMGKEDHEVLDGHCERMDGESATITTGHGISICSQAAADTPGLFRDYYFLLPSW